MTIVYLKTERFFRTQLVRFPIQKPDLLRPVLRKLKRCYDKVEFTLFKKSTLDFFIEKALPDSDYYKSSVREGNCITSLSLFHLNYELCDVI